MNHKISAFCDKIDSVKKMADDLRVLKYKTPKSNDLILKLIEPKKVTYFWNAMFKKI